MNRQPTPRGDFVLGLAWGGIIGFAAMLAPIVWLGTEGTAAFYGRIAPALHGLWQVATSNLQGSILPFAVVLIAYWFQLNRLRDLLQTEDPQLEHVVRHEQMLDLCANLFFGIGVIWTAIGMRNALLHALGDPGITASEGAFAILQRLVDGGILLALSTTIVGGIGGYLMRAVKSIVLGQELTALYLHDSQRGASQNLAALERIEQLLNNSPDAPTKDAQ